MEEALQVCLDNQVDMMVIGGDLWQSRAGQNLDTLMAVYDVLKLIKNADVQVVIAPGNHDKVDPEAYVSYNHIFSDIATVIDESLTLDVNTNVKLHVIAYFPENGSFTERLAKIETPSDCFNILYCHEGINGALATPSEKELPVNTFTRFDSVLVGHYHNRTKIPGTAIEYIGASRQHNFGEDDMKGYTLLYSDGSTLFVQNKVNRRYATIEVTSENIDEAKKLLSELSKVNDNTKVRLRISCDSDKANTIDKQTLIELGADKVEVVSNTTITKSEALSFDAKYDNEGLKAEYKKFCENKEINPDMGLLYLNKLV